MRANRLDDIKPYIEHLRGLPFVLDVQVEPMRTGEDLARDAWIRLDTPAGEVLLTVHHKHSHLTAGIVDQVLRALGTLGEPWILLAPHIGGPLGRRLAEQGVNYLDLNGNCHLVLAPHYMAHIEGRTQRREPSGRGAGAAGYLVLYALLANSELVTGTVREIARAAGVSTQAVTGMMARLSEQDLLFRKGQGRGVTHGWSPRGRVQALDQWLRGYADLVRPRLVLGRFRTQDDDPGILEPLVTDRLGGGDWLWGGATAAWRLEPWYRATHTTIHVPVITEDLRRGLRALPDARGNLVVLALPPPVGRVGPEPRCVEPLFAYTEMLTQGGEREREAAHRLRERYMPWSLP